MTNEAGTRHNAWINQIQEEAVEPALPIVDAHHHLWLDNDHTGWPYGLNDLYDDIVGGHNIRQTVFLECHAEYRTNGPDAFRSVGETAFVAKIAAQSDQSGKARIAAIMSNADLALGDGLEDVLMAHQEAGDGRFRGIRYSTAQDDHPPLKMRPSMSMADTRFVSGINKLGDMGLTFDSMVYYPQLPALIEAIRQCPDTPIVVNHLGCILGTGPYKDRRDEVLEFWRMQMTALSQCQNVYLKVGGIGMPMMGYRWDKQAVPPDSQTLAAPWVDPIRFVIDEFGPERCMFESNFPIDKRGAGYTVLWNAYKRIAGVYSEEEKLDMFHNTAARAYRIETVNDIAS